jgi:hypothetical protein
MGYNWIQLVQPRHAAEMFMFIILRKAFDMSCVLSTAFSVA